MLALAILADFENPLLKMASPVELYLSAKSARSWRMTNSALDRMSRLAADQQVKLQEDFVFTCQRPSHYSRRIDFSYDLGKLDLFLKVNGRTRFLQSPTQLSFIELDPDSKGWLRLSASAKRGPSTGVSFYVPTYLGAARDCSAILDRIRAREFVLADKSTR